jgi:hypothetical protein
MSDATIEPVGRLQGDLRSMIERAIVNHPRSQQQLVGPSEIGTPCTRKLAHRIAQTPAVGPEMANWRATVGTAVHAWLAGALEADNRALGVHRWSVEQKVYIGDIGADGIFGSCDVLDHLTATAIDWKIPSITTVKAKRSAKHPGTEYRIQVHTYACGWEAFDIPVKNVAVYFLPAAGELADGYFWSEPHDCQVTTDALKRANDLELVMRGFGPANVIPQLATAPDYCSGCKWYRPGATDLARECPGDPNMTNSWQSKPALSLVPKGMQ